MLLKVQNISVHYKSFEALSGVSMELGEGETVTILGANGAGKTTLVKAVCGLLKLSAGLIEFDGRRVDNLPPHMIVSLGISLCPEGRRLFPKMPVYKNLSLGAYTVHDKGTVNKTYDFVVGLFPVLKQREKQLAGTLSGGEQQMLAIGRALMSRPKLLIMDEPSQGLAPLVVSNIYESIRSIKQQGVTVLLVEQNAAESLKIADKGYVMEAGKVALTDTAENLLKNEAVKKAYLGI